MGRPVDSASGEKAGTAEITIIAHRGASAYFPENTLPSFEAAVELGADMVELDVQLSRDGEVIVFHDATLERCTNGRGRTADHSLKELKRLDAGSWFDRRFAGTCIPTLEEVLAQCRGKLDVNIEIKNEAVTAGGGMEEQCLDIVDRCRLSGRVLFSSFNPSVLRRLRQLNRHIPVAVLYDKSIYGSELPSEITALYEANAFNCGRNELDGTWLVDLHEHGIPVNVYTVDGEEEMNRLIGAGVDGIFTNRPDVLRKLVDSRRNGTTNDCFRQGDKNSRGFD